MLEEVDMVSGWRTRSDVRWLMLPGLGLALEADLTGDRVSEPLDEFKRRSYEERRDVDLAERRSWA